MDHTSPEVISREGIHICVDNSASDSASIDSSIDDYIGDTNTCGNGCSASIGIVAPLQALPPTPVASTPSPTTINAGSKSALVIENSNLLKIIKEFLEREGYVVRSARNGAEGLRLYGFCAPFDVVLIDYCVPQTNGVEIDYFAPQKDGIELAMAILKKDPLQRMIIWASDYQHEDAVPRPTDLMHIPFVIGTRQLRKWLEKLQYWATREEVVQAIEALSDADLRKLTKIARVRGLGSTPRGAWEDLPGEALLSTLIGAEHSGNGRRWNKRVDFMTYLVGAMRSISNHWKDKFDQREVLECKAVISDAEGQELSPLDNVASGDRAADQRLITKEEVGRILGLFKDDKEVILVLQGWSKGMKKSEVMQEHGLTEKQYQAAVKRIRVKLVTPKKR